MSFCLKIIVARKCTGFSSFRYLFFLELKGLNINRLLTYTERSRAEFFSFIAKFQKMSLENALLLRNYEKCTISHSFCYLLLGVGTNEF